MRRKRHVQLRLERVGSETEGPVGARERGPWGHGARRRGMSYSRPLCRRCRCRPARTDRLRARARRRRVASGAYAPNESVQVRRAGLEPATHCFRRHFGAPRLPAATYEPPGQGTHTNHAGVMLRQVAPGPVLHPYCFCPPRSARDSISVSKNTSAWLGSRPWCIRTTGSVRRARNSKWTGQTALLGPRPRVSLLVLEGVETDPWIQSSGERLAGTESTRSLAEGG
jgi:hypothetical protein